MPRAQGARAQMALAFEAEYGVAPASGFRLIPFARSNLGSQQPLLDNELLGFGRDPVAPSQDAPTTDGDVVIPIDLRNIGLWLKAAFGAPTTTDNGDDSHTHVFVSGAWELPSFSIETGMPEIPRYAMASGCRLNQLSWTMQRTGLLTASASLVAQSETKAAASQAGALSAFDLQRFGHFHGAVTREGAALGNVTSSQITWSNNLDLIEDIRPGGVIGGADPSVAALTGRMDVRFADQVLMDQALAGAPCELTFGYAISAKASLTVTAHAVHLPRPKVPIEGPAGIQASFDWQGAQGSIQGGGDARMATVTLVNDVEAY